MMKAIILAIFLGTSSIMSAQVTNDSTSDVHISLNLEGRGNLFSGVFEQIAWNSAAHFHIERKRLSFNSFGSYRFNRTANHIVENDFINFSVVSLASRKGAFFSQAFYYFENSRLFRINNRNVGVLGFGTEFFRKKQYHEILSSIGLGYENTSFGGDVFVNSNLTSNRRDGFLAALRIVQKHHFNKMKLSVSNLLLFRQSLEEIDDFFILVRPKFNYHISKVLSFGLGYNLKYEHVHLANLKRLNTALFMGFEVNLETKKKK